jgi:prophage antirepressor-like protein
MEQNLFNQPKQDNQISIFDFETQQVRTVIIDNDIWFVASDVTKILGYLDGRKAVLTHTKGGFKKKLPTKGGMQELTLINESDLYSLVLKSDTKNSKQFQEWVTEKILPSIRKTGSYTVTPKPELSIEEMTLLVIQNMRSKIADQSRQLEEQKPKVEFADKISTIENAVSIGDYAKVIGWGQNKLFSQLRDLKILNDSNIPYQKFIDAGYFKVIEWILEKKNQAKFKTLITGKGQLYLSERIK